MATERQVEANRQNARLSTGPTSEEGRAVSRGNALRHGLAGAGVVLTPDEAAEVAVRTVEWAAVFRPAGPVERFQLGQYVLESVRVERCQAEERALLRRLSERALDPRAWDDDRRLAAESVAGRLGKKPAHTVRRLRQTVQGCDWLLERWNGLALAVASGRPWDDPQRTLALDLLGIPSELRGGPTPLDPLPDGDAVATQSALAAGRIAELTRLRDEVLTPRDEDDREAATLGVGHGDGDADGVDPTHRALRLVRRYEAACQRRLDRSLRLLLSGRLHDPSALAAPAEPQAAPAPPRPALAGTLTRPVAVKVPVPVPVPVAMPIPVATPHLPPVRPVERDPSADPDHPRGNRRWRKARQRQARHVHA